MNALKRNGSWAHLVLVFITTLVLTAALTFFIGYILLTPAR